MFVGAIAPATLMIMDFDDCEVCKKSHGVDPESMRHLVVAIKN